MAALLADPGARELIPGRMDGSRWSKWVDHQTRGQIMGFFGKLKSALEQNSRPKAAPADPAQFAFAKALKAAITVMSDFGAALEVLHPEDGQGIYLDEKRLPHSRETIMWACDWLQKTLASSACRASVIRILPPDRAQHLFSESYANTLKAGRAALDYFVPEEKLAEQQALSTLIVPTCESLPPELLAKQAPVILGFLEDFKKAKKS